MLDNRYTIETPDGIDLVLRPAGIMLRVFAYLIDALIRGAILAVILLPLNYFGVLGIGLSAVCFFLLEWFYPVVFEIYRAGRTPGKQWMGLRVVQDDGSPLGWSASLIRNLLRAIDFLPLMYVSGLISLFCNAQFKRLGDLAAGTLVIYDKALPTGHWLEINGCDAPPCALQVEEQQALIAFAESGRRLSKARQQELANLLVDLTQQQNEAGLAQLVRYANHLAGRS